MRLIDILPAVITSGLVGVVLAAIVVAWKYGAVFSYVLFVWVTPSASVLWLKWGENQLGFQFSSLNIPFVMAVLLLGFVVGIVCFPVLLYLNWRRLSAIKKLGLGLCAVAHSFPFSLYLLIWVSVLIWGK
jgi:hypothetical protein